LDGELPATERQNVEAHILDCLQCREFARTARKIAVDPFVGVPKAGLDEAKIWQKVSAELNPDPVPQPQGQSTFAAFLERIKEGFFSAPLVPAFSFAVIVLLAAAVYRYMPGQPGQAAPISSSTIQLQLAEAPVDAPWAELTEKAEQNVDYIAYVVDDFADSPSESDNYGTGIEEYFL